MENQELPVDKDASCLQSDQLLCLYQHLQSPLTWLEQARRAHVLITGSTIWNLPGRDVDSTSVTALLRSVVISDWPLCHQRQTVFKAIHPFFTQM